MHNKDKKDLFACRYYNTGRNHSYTSYDELVSENPEYSNTLRLLKRIIKQNKLQTQLSLSEKDQKKLEKYKIFLTKYKKVYEQRRYQLQVERTVAKKEEAKKAQTRADELAKIIKKKSEKVTEETEKTVIKIKYDQWDGDYDLTLVPTSCEDEALELQKIRRAEQGNSYFNFQSCDYPRTYDSFEDEKDYKDLKTRYRFKPQIDDWGIEDYDTDK